MYKTIKTKCGYYTIDCAKENLFFDLMDVVRKESGDELTYELIKYCRSLGHKLYSDFLFKDSLNRLEEAYKKLEKARSY